MLVCLALACGRSAAEATELFILLMSQSLVTVIQTQHVKPNYWKMMSNLAEQKDTGVSGEAFAFWVGERF